MKSKTTIKITASALCLLFFLSFGVSIVQAADLKYEIHIYTGSNASNAVKTKTVKVNSKWEFFVKPQDQYKKMEYAGHDGQIYIVFNEYSKYEKSSSGIMRPSVKILRVLTVRPEKNPFSARHIPNTAGLAR